VVAGPADQGGRTIADGTRTQAIGARNLAHLLAYLDDIVTVSEDEIVAAVQLAAEECRLVVEPSGALSIAALRFRSAAAGLSGLTGSRVAVVSGGNLDPERYRQLLAGDVVG
jgi:threonine dehydratase